MKGFPSHLSEAVGRTLADVRDLAWDDMAYHPEAPRRPKAMSANGRLVRWDIRMSRGRYEPGRRREAARAMTPRPRRTHGIREPVHNSPHGAAECCLGR